MSENPNVIPERKIYNFKPPKQYYKTQDEEYGKVIQEKRNSKTFELTKNRFLTILSQTPNTYVNNDGVEEKIDNTIIKKNKSKTESYFKNKSNVFEAELPFNSGRGLKITKEELKIEFTPLEGDFSNFIAEDNAIIYNDVLENIDYQYTILNTSVKEDIILKKKGSRNIFKYELKILNGKAKFKDNKIYITKKDDDIPIYEISVPMMVDAKGNTCFNINLYLKNINRKNIVYIELDKQWLFSEDRNYEIRISTEINIPIQTGSTMAIVEEFGHPTGIGITRIFSKIPLIDIPADASILSSTLKIYQASYHKLNKPANEVILCKVDDKDWDPSSLIWENQPLAHTFIDGPRTFYNSEFLTFDITELINGWIKGIYPNYGIVLKSYDERMAQCDKFYFQNIYIEWEIYDPVDEDYPLDDLKINLRPIMEKNSEGKQLLDGVFIDGMATPKSLIEYWLKPEDPQIEGLSIASRGYKYPDSSVFQSIFPDGTKYKARDSNWQSFDIATNLKLDKLYKFYAIASKDYKTGLEKTSESFILYEMKSKDTFPFVANHYGVPYGDLIKDNRIEDALLTTKNTLFIRNPKRNQENPYNLLPSAEIEDVQIKNAVLGKQENCVFGYNSINLNTGNFFMEKEDTSIDEMETKFSITRCYNSKGEAYNSFFGRRWSFNYCETLTKLDDGTIVYYKGDGSAVYFERDELGGYKSTEGLYYSLRKIRHVEGEFEYFTWELTDNKRTVKSFDILGIQREIKDIKGRITRINYDENYRLKEIMSPFGKSFKIEMDDGGKIVSITLPNNSVLKYEYNSKDDLIAYTDALGKITKYNYDENHLMTSWIDPNDNVAVTNIYDVENRVTLQRDGNDNEIKLVYTQGMTRVYDSGGNITNYYQDNSFRSTRIEYPDGSIEEKYYDVEGNLKFLKDGAECVTEYEYDSKGNLINETRADGYVKSYEYNHFNLPVKIIDFDGAITRFQYDERGNLIETINPDESFVRFEYDSLSRMVKKTDPIGNISFYSYEGGALTSFKDPKGNIYKFVYNPMNQVITKVDSEENEFSILYNSRGEVIEEKEKDGGITTYDYDNNGNIIKIIDPKGNATVFIYNKVNKVIEKIDSKGNKTSYFYDNNNLEIKTIDQRGLIKTKTYDSMKRISEEIDENGITIKYKYDLQGNIVFKEEPNDAETWIEWDEVLKKPIKITDPQGAASIYKYDTLGRLTQVIEPNGGMIFYEYDIMGRLVKTIDQLSFITELCYDLNGNILEIRDSEDRVFEYEYDGNNNLIKTINPLGEVVEYFYDKLNRIETVKDEAKKDTKFSYDAVGRLNEVKNSLEESIKTIYDLSGNKIQFIDANGNSYKYEYDQLNLLTKEIDPLENITKYEYDQSGNLTLVLDPLNNKTLYGYNNGSLIIKYIDGNERAYYFAYDEAGNNTKIFFPDGTESTFIYDNMKRISSEITPKGLIRNYRYDVMGNIESIWDNAGNSITYEYDLKGQLIRKTDVLGRSEIYNYNSLGEIIKVKLMDGTENKFTYDPLGRLKSLIDEEGKVTTFEYDISGNLIKKQDPGDKIFKYIYDSDKLVESIDPLGAKTSFEYDSNGNLTKVTDACGNSETYSYNPLNLLKEFCDKNGNVTSYGFDPLKRLSEILDPEGGKRQFCYDPVGNLIKEIDPLKNEKIYEYDGLNNLVQVTFPEGGKINYKYDPHGVLEEVMDEMGNITKYETDLNDKVTKIRKPNGGVYSYTYDKASRLKSVKTPDRLLTEFLYDDKNNLIEEKDSLGRVKKYVYDTLHRLIEVEDSLGNKTSYSYDIFGNKESIINAKGFKNSFAYDLIGRLLLKIDPLGKVTKYEYDSIGNLEKIVKPGERITSFKYDGNGNILENIDPMGYKRSYSYDKLNRLVKEINPQGKIKSINYDLNGNITKLINERNEITEFFYDGNNNLIRRIDERGHITKFWYDLKDRVVNEIDPLDVFTTYKYDGEGNLVTFIDGNGNITQYSYDLMNRLTEIKDVKGYITKNVYDTGGRLREVIKPNGEVINYDYDKLNLLIEKRYNNIAEEQVNYYYNELGQRVAMGDATGGYKYNYDELGRLIEATQGDNVIRYEYDKCDQLSAIIYPDGKRIDYSYDKNDKLIKVADDDKTIEYSYDELGNVLSAKRSTGVWTNYDYDEKGQIIKLENLRNEEIISSFEYVYDNKGNIISEVSTEGEVKVERIFSYDELDRLIFFSEKEGLNTTTNFEYSYDNVGNKVSSVKTGEESETIIYEYNASNELISENSDKYGKTIYKYDENGNLVSKINGVKFEDLRYEYTVENRLKAVLNGGRILMAATYNGDNDRVFSAYRKNNKEFLSQDQSYFATSKETWYKDIKKVFAGPVGNMMFIKNDGSLFAGGNNDYGMLGVRQNGRLLVPQKVNSTNIKFEALKVEMGAYHTLLLDVSGNVYSSGLNNYGQLGQGDTLNLNIFTKVDFGENIIIKDISVAGSTSYALDTEGRLWGFGSGSDGALGDGRVSVSINSTPKIIQTNVVLMSASKSCRSNYSDNKSTICILKNDGKVYAAGQNCYGQQGDGTTSKVKLFKNIEFFNDKVIDQIETGTSNIKILTQDGKVYVAGQNIYGELGIGNKTQINTFQEMILPEGKVAIKIFRTSTSSFVELDDGTVWGCGNNASGNLGYRSDESSDSESNYDPCRLTNMVTLEQVQDDRSIKILNPVEESNKTSKDIYRSYGGRVSKIMDLTGSFDETFMVDAAGVLRIAGISTNHGTCGKKETGSNQYQFYRVSKQVLKEQICNNIKDVFAGPIGNMMFIREDGVVFAGGNNDYGMLGVPQKSGKLSSPQCINMTNIKGEIKKIEMGANHTLMLDDLGNVYASGRNTYGQLGQGNTANLNIFTEVDFGESVIIKDISASGSTSYALDINRNLWGFGSGGDGSLGDGKSGVFVNSIPKIIEQDVVMMSSSKSNRSYYSDNYNTICIMKSDGKLYAAGQNFYGQQGNGKNTRVTKFENIEFFNDKEVKQIELGATNMKVLTGDGKVYAAGQNIWGELGIGNKDMTNTFKEMILPTEMTCTKIFRTSTTTFVELSDGNIWATGSNDSGDLGFGSNRASRLGNAWDPCTLTNPVTREQVQFDGSLSEIVLNGSKHLTSSDIYANGRIKNLSGGWDENFMVDSIGTLRVTGGGGDYDTSLKAETGSNRFQFHRVVLTVDRLYGEPIIPEELEKQLDDDYELTYYINDINRLNPEVLVDYNRKNNSKNSYIYGLQRLWNENEGYVYDGKGSVSQLLDKDNGIKSQYRYDPFGEMVKGGPVEKSIFGYLGQEYNPCLESLFKLK